MLKRLFGRPSAPEIEIPDLTPYRGARGNAHAVLAQVQASEAALEKRLPGQPAYGPWSHGPSCRCTWCR